MNWKFTIRRATALALTIAFCLEMMHFSLAEEETALEPPPRDMTAEYVHSLHISYCVS
jgi:hypothetical protein